MPGNRTNELGADQRASGDLLGEDLPDPGRAQGIELGVEGLRTVEARA
ncbi:hypothetical protein [Nocardia asiatica]|nr:hypothetical protein [Nocardia asiatica]